MAGGVLRDADEEPAVSGAKSWLSVISDGELGNRSAAMVVGVVVSVPSGRAVMDATRTPHGWDLDVDWIRTQVQVEC